MVGTSNELVPEVAIDEINQQKRGSHMTMETFIWKKIPITVHSYGTKHVLHSYT